MKAIKPPQCCFGRLFVFEVESTDPITKEVTTWYEARKAVRLCTNGVSEWQTVGTFSEFESAKAVVDQSRAVVKAKPVY
jgi:hypothetical protein